MNKQTGKRDWPGLILVAATIVLSVLLMVFSRTDFWIWCSGAVAGMGVVVAMVITVKATKPDVTEDTKK